MKKLYTLVAAVLLTAISFAQSPEKMSYQAVVRNSGDDLVANQAIGMQISILQGSAIGTAVYIETQSPTTNINGLVSFEIGNGMIVSGTFAAIDWSAGPYFIKTETDPTGGSSYSITGTSQLLSVPFALYSANTAGLDLKADKASPTFTGDVIFDTNGVSFNGGNVAFDNGQTFVRSAQVFNSAENFFYGPSVEFNTATNFATGTLNILNSAQAIGNVLTDVNGDGVATWQAPVTSTIADGSITEAKLAFDTATQTELNLKADIDSPTFTGNVGIGADLNIVGNMFANGGLFLNSWDVYANPGIFSINESGVEPHFNIIPGGNVGIGTSGPTAKLDIVGTVKIVDGTEGAGKVLTSDVDGLASWQLPTAGSIANGSITEAKLAFDTATQDELDLKAPLLNPSFTGNITTIGNNSGLFYELSPSSNYFKFVGNNHAKMSGTDWLSLQIGAIDKLLVTGSSIIAKDDLIVETTIETPSIKVTGGTILTGNVLTSDATGNATWQSPTAGSIADASITEAKLAFDTATQTELNLKADKASPTLTGNVVFATIGVNFNGFNVDFNNELTSFGGSQIFNSTNETNFLGGDVNFNNQATTFNTGIISILNSPQATGSVLTDVNGDGNATWQAPTAGVIADGSITEAKLSTSVNTSLDLADTAVQPAALNVKANIASPNITGTLTTESLTVNAATSFNNGNVIINGSVPQVAFNNGMTSFSQVVSFDALTNFNTFETNFNSGDVKFNNSTKTAGHVLTDVNGDGIATWQAPGASGTIADGSITKAKLSTTVNASLDLADTAVQPAALNAKSNLVSPSFTTPSLGVATASSINGVAIANGGNPAAYLNGSGTYTVPAGGAAPTYVVGTNYAQLGGIVVWVSSNGQHGLVAEAGDMVTYNVSWYNAQDVTSVPSNHGGSANQFRDWRLPTRSEAYEMHAINALNLYGYYWTSNELNSDSTKAIMMELFNVGNPSPAAELPQLKTRADINNMRSVRTF